jgi:hypothetical protein
LAYRVEIAANDRKLSGIRGPSSRHLTQKKKKLDFGLVATCVVKVTPMLKLKGCEGNRAVLIDRYDQ